MLLPLLLLVAPARAEDGFEATLGLEHVINDPYLKTLGATATVGYGLADRAVIELSGGFYPAFGSSADWTLLTRELVDELHIAPDISRIHWRGALALRLTPFEGKVGRGTSYVSGRAGFGLVHTSDDLEALQVESGDVMAISTAVQNHPAAVWGFSAGYRIWHVQFALHVERCRYIETVWGTTLENKAPVFTGFTLGGWAG